mgnify:CR=1 FL=1
MSDMKWYINGHMIMIDKPERAYLGAGSPEAVCEMVSSLSPETTARNARAIAAVPDLIAALEAIEAQRGALQVGITGWEIIAALKPAMDLVREALAKAKGE